MDTFYLSESLTHESALVHYYSPALSDFSFEDGFGAEHHLPLGSGNYLSYLARELPVHFAFPRALLIWLFWGRLCFAERDRLRWKIVDVHRAHRSLEQGSMASASRATLRDGLKSAG